MLIAEQQFEAYRRMLRIRYFEERCARLVKKGQLTTGVIHPSIGQEAEVVGACMALRDNDYMTGTHRSHGHPIGKGADLKPLMAELFGKVTGVCKGKGGSMHLASFKHGSLGESGVVGGSIPVATGAGLSAKIRGSDQVCLCFFGDGAAAQGTLHESLNMASIWRLPVIYLCENNLYAVTSSVRYALAAKNIADFAAAYQIPGVVVDGQDLFAVHEVVTAAVQRARVGEGPTLIEAKTYRFHQHAEMGGLSHPSYRSDEEVAAWLQRDPIILFRTRLLDSGLLTASMAAAFEAAALAEVDAAVEFANDSDFPLPDAVYEDILVSPDATASVQRRM